jgi:predicted RecA/RadA family phage recombinase
MDKLIYYLDNQGPAIIRSLSSMIGENSSGDFDVEAGQAFTLKVRSLYGSTVLLDKAMAPDVDTDTVTYQPQPGDFSAPGIFIAKKVLADNVLYAAISFWMNQVIQRTAQGNTAEVETYPDRIRAAEAAIGRYRDDLERQAGEVAKILGSVSNAFDAPMVDTVGPMLTPGLDEYPMMPVSVPNWLGRLHR